MIHTVNLYCTFTSLEVYNYSLGKLKNYVNSLQYNLYPNKSNNSHYQCYKTHAFNDIGLSSINLFRYFSSKPSSYIELVVNCPKLIYNADETKLANVTDYNILEEKFNRIIQHLNHEVFSTNLLPNLSGWQVRRIDYAVDIVTPFVNEYTAIFNKGYIPKGFSLKEYYNTSFHIKSDACNYNFYNKTEELAAKHNTHISSNDSDLPKAYKHYAWQLTKLLNSDIFNLSELYQIIETSEEYKKDLLKEILHLYQKRLTEKRFNKTKAAIKGLNYSYAKSYLNKINLSPIAIPQNCQAEYLPNPLKLIQ